MRKGWVVKNPTLTHVTFTKLYTDTKGYKKMIKKYIETGEIVGLHGFNGDIRIYSWSDGVDFFKTLKKLYTGYNEETGTCENVYKIKEIRQHKNVMLCKFVGIENAETARPLVGEVLYVSRKDIKLEKDRFFVQDIMGLEVKDAKTDEVYGKIVDITHPANSDLYSIQTKDGIVLFPAVPAFLGEINPEKGYVTINPIKGMFDECE